MKLLLLWLLPLLGYFPAAAPVPVRVTFSPLTKAAYLAAKKAAVSTKPAMIFPLKKVRGRIVIPTSKGPKIFQDNDADEENSDWEKYTYLSYWPEFECHLILHNHYEWSNYILLSKSGHQEELYDLPRFSPDRTTFVVISGGIEYWAFPNSIRLFRFEKGYWQQVWKVEPSIEPMTWEPDEIYWLSNSTLLLKKKMWVGSSLGKTFTYAKLEIR